MATAIRLLCKITGRSEASTRRGIGPENAPVARRGSGFTQNRHPAQELLQGAVEGMAQIYRFTEDTAESGGAAWDVTTRCFFRRGGGVARRARGKRPMRRGLAGSLDCRWPHAKYFAYGGRR